MNRYHLPSKPSVTIGNNTYSSGTATQNIQDRKHHENVNNIRVTSIEHTLSYKVSKVPIVKTGLLAAGGKIAVNNVKKALGRNTDMGSQIAKGVVVAGVASYVYFKGVKTATPIVARAIKNLPSNIKATGVKIVKVGKGVYEVCTTTTRVVVTVVRSLPYTRSGFVAFTRALRTNAVITGLNKTAISKRILKNITKVRTKLTTFENTVKNPNVLKKKSKEIGKRTLSKAKRKIRNTSASAVKKGIPGVAKASYKISVGVGGALSRSDNDMLKMTGNSIRTAAYSIKTGVITTKISAHAIKTVAKGGYRTAQTTYRTISYIHKNGFKAAFSRMKNKVGKAITKAGKSIVSAVIDGIKNIAKKMVVPLVVGIGLIAVILSLGGGAASAISYYLSGDFLFDNGDGTYTLTDIKTFLYNNTVEYGLPIEREKEIDYVEYLAKMNLKTTSDIIGKPIGVFTGVFDAVEFKIEYDDYYVDITETDTAREKIAYRFYTVDELYEVVQPIFYAALLAEHDLEPSKEEAIETLDEIFKIIFDHEMDVRTKLCYDYGGEHSCGLTHSLSTCPNRVRIVHTEYTCNYCCKYVCEGHEQMGCALQMQEGHICDENCEQETYTSFCEGCIFVCTGEEFCNGHLVAQYTWNMKDVEHFFEEYFEIPIQELEEEDERTAEEEERLKLLKDYYALSKAYLEG